MRDPSTISEPADVRPLESGGSSPAGATTPNLPKSLPVGLVALASALAGGLAVAWYYRNTLARFRQAGEVVQSPDLTDPFDDQADGI